MTNRIDKKNVSIQVGEENTFDGEPLPLKILVLSEFIPKDKAGNPSELKMDRVFMDKDSFAKAMQQLAGSVTLIVSNRLATRPKDLTLTIPLHEIKSFRPDTIAETVSPLKELLQIRKMVMELREGRLSFGLFQKQLVQIQGGTEVLNRIQMGRRSDWESDKPSPLIQEKPQSGKRSGVDDEKDRALESIFEMVEIEGKREPPSGSGANVDSMLNRLMGLTAKTEGADSTINRNLATQIIVDLDETLTAQINEILHHPEFRRLEATWRGLKFLIDRTDFREPIRMEILSLPKELLRDGFETYVSRSENEGLSPVPVSLIIADYAFSRASQDIELLKEISEKAQRLQIPFISSIGSRFLGKDSIEDIEKLPFLTRYFQEPDYIKWNSYRQGDSSRWVALVFNRFLLRIPYGPDHARIKSFGFREFMRGRLHEDHLWGNPVWAVASLLSASFAKTGWCSDITGRRTGGSVEDLPVYETRVKSGERIQLPLELMLSVEQQGDFAENGIIALTCSPNSDSAMILSAPTTHLPKKYSESEASTMSGEQAKLAYQIAAGRIAYFLGRIIGNIGQGQSPDLIRKIITEGLSQILSTSGLILPGAVEVEVGETEESRDRYQVSIIVRSDRAQIGDLPPFEINISIPR